MWSFCIHLKTYFICLRPDCIIDTAADYKSVLCPLHLNYKCYLPLEKVNMENTFGGRACMISYNNSSMTRNTNLRRGLFCYTFTYSFYIRLISHEMGVWISSSLTVRTATDIQFPSCNQSFWRFCLVTLLIGILCWCKGFCHTTGSDLLLFSSNSQVFWWIHVPLD